MKEEKQHIEPRMSVWDEKKAIIDAESNRKTKIAKHKAAKYRAEGKPLKALFVETLNFLLV